MKTNCEKKQVKRIVRSRLLRKIFNVSKSIFFRK